MTRNAFAKRLAALEKKLQPQENWPLYIDVRFVSSGVTGGDPYGDPDEEPCEDPVSTPEGFRVWLDWPGRRKEIDT